MNLRLRKITEYVEKNDILVDIGTDHGYLPIYLKQNNLVKEVYASDISKYSLEKAIENIKKENLNIKTFKSNGFQNIDIYFDTAVISGMGTSSILNIINNPKCPNKLILSSNNEYYKLRKELNKLGYKLIKEQVVYENKYYYPIMLYKKDKQKLNYSKLKFGISNNKEYYKYLLKLNNKIIKKVPFKKKIILKYDNYILKGLIEKK